MIYTPILLAILGIAYALLARFADRVFPRRDDADLTRA